MNSYDLSRMWFDFSFSNPDKIKPIHTAIYFFAIEHCNRLGWKKKFGFPTSMVLEATGIKSYSAYKKHFDEIVEFGFFTVHEYSKNQYSSNVIELSLKVKALGKALDKALIKHSSKQVQSTSSIDKPLTNKQRNNKQGIPTINEFLEYFKLQTLFNYDSYLYSVTAKYEQWVSDGWKDGNDNEIKNWKTKLKNTLPHLKPLQFNQSQTPIKPKFNFGTDDE